MCGKFGMQKNDGFLSMLLGTFFLFVEYILLKVESFPTNSTNCFIRNTKQKIKPRLSIQWKKIHIWTRQPPSHTNTHREQQSQTDSDTQKNPQTKMKKKNPNKQQKKRGKKTTNWSDKLWKEKEWGANRSDWSEDREWKAQRMRRGGKRKRRLNQWESNKTKAKASSSEREREI